MAIQLGSGDLTIRISAPALAPVSLSFYSFLALANSQVYPAYIHIQCDGSALQYRNGVISSHADLSDSSALASQLQADASMAAALQSTDALSDSYASQAIHQRSFIDLSGLHADSDASNLFTASHADTASLAAVVFSGALFDAALPANASTSDSYASGYSAASTCQDIGAATDSAATTTAWPVVRSDAVTLADNYTGATTWFCNVLDAATTGMATVAQASQYALCLDNGQLQSASQSSFSVSGGFADTLPLSSLLGSSTMLAAYSIEAGTVTATPMGYAHVAVQAHEAALSADESSAVIMAAHAWTDNPVVIDILQSATSRADGLSDSAQVSGYPAASGMTFAELLETLADAEQVGSSTGVSVQEAAALAEHYGKAALLHIDPLYVTGKPRIAHKWTTATANLVTRHKKHKQRLEEINK